MSIFLYSNFLFLILWKMRESYSMAFFLCRQHQYDNPATFTLPSLSLSRESFSRRETISISGEQPPANPDPNSFAPITKKRDCRRRRVKQLNLPPHIQQQQQHIGELLSRSFSNLSAIAHYYFDLYSNSNFCVTSRVWARRWYCLRWRNPQLLRTYSNAKRVVVVAKFLFCVRESSSSS